MTSSPSFFSDLPPLIPDNTGTGAILHTALRNYAMTFQLRLFPSRDVAETTFNILALKRKARIMLEHYSSGSHLPGALDS